MTIYVTQKHIEEGKPRQCKHCPIALAIQEATKEPWRVDFSSARLGEIEVDLPRHVSGFIESVDESIPVHPFSFEFPWPEGK